MKLNIYLNDNRLISMEKETFDAAEMENSLNNPQLLMLVVGNFVLNKNSIAAMAPEIPNPTVEIILHNGVSIPSYVESFNAKDIADKMNQQVLITSIGQVVFNKNIVKMVAPIEAPAQ